MYTPGKQEQFNYGFRDGVMQFYQGVTYRYTHFDTWYLKGWQAGYEEGKARRYSH